jgi:hypothetical protein
MFKKLLAVLALTVFLEFSSLASLYFKDKDQTPTGLQVMGSSANGNFLISYRGENAGPVTLMVFDATGKYVYVKNIRDFNGELKESIDMSNNPRGIYVIELEGNNFRETKKVVYQ